MIANWLAVALIMIDKSYQAELSNKNNLALFDGPEQLIIFIKEVSAK